MAGGLDFMVDGHQTMVLANSKRLVCSGWSESCTNSRVRTHETKNGGHGVPVWQQADGLWMQADAQQPSNDYVPPPPPMLAEEKKPDGGKTNFEWGANNPEVLTKDEMKDDLRAISVTLPKLPDESTPQPALRCGDWITEIEPLIGDVSGGAARWWTQLMIEVNAVYKVWLSSDALTRLAVDVQVKPNATRLEGRVTSMLLAALPSSIKSDIIANRKLTAASIMLEVMKRFQPGGLGEKSGLLRALTAPETAASPADGVEKLRLRSRCGESGGVGSYLAGPSAADWGIGFNIYAGRPSTRSHRSTSGCSLGDIRKTWTLQHNRVW